MLKYTLVALLACAIAGPLCLAETSSKAEAEIEVASPRGQGAESQASSEDLLSEDLFSEDLLSKDLFANNGERVAMTGSCTETLDCGDGRAPISCSSTASGPKACHSTLRNCPAWPGSVTCKVNETFSITKYCEDPCPPQHCPDYPGCTYQYYTATGCCVAVDPQGGNCPTVCE